MANTKKQDILANLSDIIKDNANFVLVKFDKTTHKTLEGLRRQLREKDTKVSVIKNTIFEKAINKLSEKETNLKQIREKHFPLKEKSAVLIFKGDWTEGLKAYTKAVKGDESFAFKFGMIDSTVYGDADMVKLSNLPGKDQLVAKLIGIMKNPIARTTRAMTFNMQKLVFVLSQKSQQA